MTVQDMLKEEIREINRKIIEISREIDKILENGLKTDRLIELRRLEAELFRLLKDFIWKIRKWDKRTGILGLW